MKKSIICLVLFLGVASFLCAQEQKELKLSNLTLNAGRGAFTSGLDLTVKFKNPKNSLEFTANYERGYAIYLWNLPLRIKAGISGGVFKNMPWIGPKVLITPTKFLSLLYWHGWRAGEPDNPGNEIREFFDTVGIFLSLKGFNLGYVAINFMDKKIYLPGISYSVSINSRFKFLAGIDHKSTEDTLLFRIGFSYFPEK